MIVYRVGEGQTPSGKILDRGTKSFLNIDEAYKYAIETHRNIYKSVNKRKYKLYYNTK